MLHIYNPYKARFCLEFTIIQTNVKIILLVDVNYFLQCKKKGSLERGSLMNRNNFEIDIIATLYSMFKTRV
jgi:hypothetical protein